MGLFRKRKGRATRKAEAKALKHKATLEAKLGAKNERKQLKSIAKAQRKLSLAQKITERMDTSSGLYQMFAFLGDAVILPERGSDGAMWTHTSHPSGSGHDGFTSVVSNGTVLAAVPQHEDEGALEPSYRLQVDGAWLAAAQVS